MAPRSWLNPGEEVVVHVRPHWSYLGRPATAVVLVLVGAVAAISANGSTTLEDILAGLLGVALLWLVLRYARWSTTVLILTTLRLVRRGGVFGRRTRSLPLVQIGDVQLRRRMRDRMIGTGDVVVTSLERGSEVFARMPRPVSLQRAILRETERARMAAGPTTWADRLQRLEALWRRGSISRAQFEAERSRFMGR